MLSNLSVFLYAENLGVPDQSSIADIVLNFYPMFNQLRQWRRQGGGGKQGNLPPTSDTPRPVRSMRIR